MLGRLKDKKIVFAERNILAFKVSDVPFANSLLKKWIAFQAVVGGSVVVDQGCQIFLATTYQKRKNVPNNQKIYPMDIKYTYKMQ
jgi:hypothetical protein